MPSTAIHVGEVRERLRDLADESVHCVVTSPPYFGLRDYGVDGQIGLEATPDAYVAELVAVFREVRRVLRADGTLWLNLGDSYNNRTKVRTSSHQPALNGFTDDNWSKRAARGGVRMSRSDGDLKEKDLIGIPWMVAFALRADGWYLRQDIIWAKRGGMPESIHDRCGKSHEYLFLMAKSKHYYFDAESIKEPLAETSIARLKQNVAAQTGTTRAVGKTNGNLKAQGNLTTGLRNKRSVWRIATQPFKGAHFATFPPDLVRPCIMAGCPVGGTVLDPFFGAGTTGLVANQLGRNCIGVELNPEYATIAAERLGIVDSPPLVPATPRLKQLAPPPFGS